MKPKLLTSLFAVTILTTSASADDIPLCLPPIGVHEISSLDDAPRAVQFALRGAIGEVVAPGTPFDSGDIDETGFTRRLIFIWSRGRRWIVATEHGGFAYNDPIFAYDLDEGDQRATLVDTVIAFPGFVCAEAKSLIQ